MQNIISNLAIVRYTFSELIHKKVFLALIILLSIALVLVLLLMDYDSMNQGVRMMFNEEELNQKNLSQLFAFFLSHPIYHTILFFSLFVGASIFPSIMEKGTAELLLTTSMTRFQLFSARLIGLLAAIFLVSMSFSLLLWLIILFKTGISIIGMISSGTYIVLAFFIVFSITSFISILSRNSMVALLVTFAVLLFVGVLLDLLYIQFPQLIENTIWSPIIAGSYWILPKVVVLREIYMVVIEYNFLPIPNLPELLSSLAFAVLMYLWGARIYFKLEY